MRRYRAALIFVIAAASSVASANAAAPDQVGWWWQPNGGVAPLPVPPPPGIPKGSLFIAADPGGDRAIAALHLQIPTNQAPTSMQLKVTSSAGTPVVRACPITSLWTPVEGGTWADRPSFDCAHQSPGSLSPDSSTISFDLSGVASAAEINLAIVPDLQSTPTAAFQVTIAPPDDSTITMTASVPVATTAPPGSFIAPAEAYPAGGATSGSFPNPNASSSGFTPPGTLPMPGEAAVESPPEPSYSQPFASNRPASATRMFDRAVNRGFLAALVLAAAVAMLGLATPRPGIAPTRRRGPGRGIGRFRHERTGRPMPVL